MEPKTEISNIFFSISCFLDPETDIFSQFLVLDISEDMNLRFLSVLSQKVTFNSNKKEKKYYFEQASAGIWQCESVFGSRNWQNEYDLEPKLSKCVRRTVSCQNNILLNVEWCNGLLVNPKNDGLRKLVDWVGENKSPPIYGFRDL